MALENIVAGNIKSEEYKFLRQEHENNRKFIFERPLLIVGATFASAITISDRNLLVLLPIAYLALLYFNLWFTHNRVESSARIVSYLQIVHEGNSQIDWIGWENSLRLYRQWIYRATRDTKMNPKSDIHQFESTAYYGPIFYFHIFVGAILTSIIVVYPGLLYRFAKGELNSFELLCLLLSILALFLFLIASIPHRPSIVRHQIELKRRIWQEVLKPQNIG